MLLDFEEHRLHRRALSVAFKSGPMKSYLADLDTGIAARVAQWKAQPGPMLFYPAMKQLTLDLAATSFLGADIGPEVDEITRAFVDMVAASVAVIRKPLPGTAMARGVKGRKRIVAYFSEQIPIRRAKGGGDDLFSQLCHATHEDGALLSTQDIIDHMSFLMMAAHDTLTSSLTSFIGELAANPEWQQKLRDEVAGLGIAADDPTSFDNLEAMPLTEMAFKEAMRLKPPVPSMPRRAMRDFTFKGYAIPAGTMVGVNPLFTHHMPEIWPEPEKFDPMRFTEEAQRNRHRFAWVPFGGGAHMCLGLHFAYMQAKCFARHFLQNLERLAGARLQAGLADVADPEAARWIAGDAEGGVRSNVQGWAKACFAPCPPFHPRLLLNGGHASLCHLRFLRESKTEAIQLLHKRRELRALVGHEHRDQFRGLGVAGIGRHQMRGARRLEERLADLERLDRTAGELRADFALGDIGGDRAGMPVRAGKPAGTIEHAHDGDALARHVRQRMRADRLDGIERRTGRIAAGTERLDHRRDRIHRRRQCLADHEGAGETGDDGEMERPGLADCDSLNVADIWSLLIWLNV